MPPVKAGASLPPRLAGFLLILGSAFLFALSTVFGKAVVSTSAVPAIELTFFRFAAGFITAGGYALVTRKSLRARAPKLVLSRGLFNTLAVIFFFWSLEYTTVSKANLLNMLYPLFVFMVAPVINRERAPAAGIALLGLSLAGTWLVAMPAGALDPADTNRGDIYALFSAVLAAVAVAYLRESTKFDEDHVIIVWLMGVGAAVTALPAARAWVTPQGDAAWWALGATAAALVGQVFITAGQRRLDASTGSLVSASRILFAMAMGVALFGDPLTTRIGAGSFLIMASLAGVWLLGRRSPSPGKGDGD